MEDRVEFLIKRIFTLMVGIPIIFLSLIGYIRVWKFILSCIEELFFN